MLRIGWARNQARKLLNRLEAAQLPIDVDKIAQQLSIEIISHKFESDDISSFLLRKPDQFIICVNERHHLNRRRFSTAHELGHFILHRDGASYFHKDYEVYFRGYIAGSDDDLKELKEVEANQFAAELLMPLTLIRNDLKINPPPTASELAKKYKVSEQAMTFRLASLRPG